MFLPSWPCSLLEPALLWPLLRRVRLLKIQKSCNVTAGSGSNIDLGIQDSSATNLSGTSNISVTCANKTPYNIGLLPSAANGGTNAGTGNLGPLNVAPVTGNTDKVPYVLHSVSAAGAAWGDTATSIAVGNGVSGTGTGVAQSIPVFATAASANYTPDSYADTVTIHVNF